MRSWENQKPPENRQKSPLFWRFAFTMHLVCTLLIRSNYFLINSISWKKRAYTALLQCRTFLCRKNGVHRGKISVVDMVFLVFIGFLYPPLAWKVFYLQPEKFPKWFSFGGGRVRFFLLCISHSSYQRGQNYYKREHFTKIIFRGNSFCKYYKKTLHSARRNEKKTTETLQK